MEGSRVDETQSQFLVSQLPLLEKIAAELSKRYRIPPKLLADLQQEGSLALVELFKQSELLPPRDAVVRAARNAMAAFAMRELRHSRRERPGTLPDQEEESSVEFDFTGLNIEERLAVQAYMRGISVRDIREALGINYQQLKKLLSSVSA